MARVADGWRAVTETVPRPFMTQTAAAPRAQVSAAGHEAEQASRSPVPAILGSVAAGVALALAYDRAGHGWRDPAAGPQDGNAIATDLHVLLEREHRRTLRPRRSAPQ